MPHHHTRAFTLIEAIIIIAILAIIGVFTLPLLFGNSQTSDLTTVTQQIVAITRQAQSQAMEGMGDQPWGIHFSNATNTTPFYALFSGTSYASGTASGIYHLPANVAFATSTLALGAKEDVVFSPISGSTPTTTIIEVYIPSKPSMYATIVAEPDGEVNPTIY